MEQKIKELKESFRKATPKNIGLIDGEIERLSRESPEEFSKAMLASLEESAREAGELAIREKLEDVLPIVSVSYLAKEYFKKTPQWFYQRLSGNIVNGKRVSFTEEEIRTLSSALDQIGNRLKESSAALN